MTDACIADIASVPAPCRGKILTPSRKLIENGLFLCQFLLYAAATLTPLV